MSDPRPIRPLPFGPRLDVLPPEAVEKVHDQTTHILERIGINVGSEKILRALAQAGASVDLDGKRVRFPRSMVEEAIRQAPRSFTAAARLPGADLLLDGKHGYLSTDGCAAELIDMETGARRASTKKDLAQITRLADALPEISFVWQSVAARDVPPEVESLHELQVQFANTGKHIQMMTAVTATAARGVVEMARVVAGGSNELKKRPILSAFVCSLSPLCYEAGALETAVVFAEAGVPCGFVVMPITCASATATVQGTLVQSNAEILAGLVALQTLVPGAATFYGSCATVMDLRSGAAACGGPEDLFYQMASAELAHHYGIPASVGTFATGAKSADWQAGLENGLSGMASALAGAELMSGAGLLFGASVFSMEQMLLDTEIFGLLCHLFAAPAQTIDETFLSVMESVGPGGQFLAERHTVDHMRKLWLPRFFDRKGWEEWEVAERPGPRQAAREKLQILLSTEEPELLDEKTAEEIQRLIRAFEREVGP